MRQSLACYNLSWGSGAADRIERGRGGSNSMREELPEIQTKCWNWDCAREGVLEASEGELSFCLGVGKGTWKEEDTDQCVQGELRVAGGEREGEGILGRNNFGGRVKSTGFKWKRENQVRWGGAPSGRELGEIRDGLVPLKRGRKTR